MPKSVYSKKPVNFYDNKGRLIRTHKDGYVIIYKYEKVNSDMPTSTKTYRDK
jgi:hypothetical protein